MTNVIQLNRYRRKERQAYLAQNGSRLEAFVDKFVRTHLSIDLQMLTEALRAQQLVQEDTAWDHHDFRDLLESALSDAIGDLLSEELRKEHWYDPRKISKDEIVDRLVTYLVLGELSASGFGRR